MPSDELFLTDEFRKNGKKKRGGGERQCYSNLRTRKVRNIDSQGTKFALTLSSWLMAPFPCAPSYRHLTGSITSF